MLGSPARLTSNCEHQQVQPVATTFSTHAGQASMPAQQNAALHECCQACMPAGNKCTHGTREWLTTEMQEPLQPYM